MNLRAWAPVLVAACFFELPRIANAACESRLEAAIRAFRADPTAIEKASAVDDAAGSCLDEARVDFADAARLVGVGSSRDGRLLLEQGNAALSFAAEKEEELGVPASAADALATMHGEGFRVVVLPAGRSACLPMKTRSLVPLATEDATRVRYASTTPRASTPPSGPSIRSEAVASEESSRA